MKTDKHNSMTAPRVLGASFLIVIVTSLLMGVLLTLPDNITDILIKINSNLNLTRISILFALISRPSLNGEMMIFNFDFISIFSKLLLG